jgi:hypothetical protein
LTLTPSNWCSDPVPTPPVPRRTPQERGINFSSLCTRNWQPLLITGLLRDLLTRHFASPLNIETPDLRKLIWQENEQTGILIESIFRWRASLVEKRPAIIIKRHAMANVRIGLGDRLKTTRQGQTVYSTCWVGSHTLFCLQSAPGAGVEILATEVLQFVSGFADVVRRYLGLFQWTVTEYGEISEVEEAKETLVIPITVGWAYNDTWLLELESPYLRKIVLDVILDGTSVAQTR